MHYDTNFDWEQAGQETVRYTAGLMNILSAFIILKKEEQENNSCYRMCIEVMKTGRISTNGRRAFSMVYLNDAVELAYQLMCVESPEHVCYHISSSEEVGEMQLTQKIRVFG